MILHYRRFKGTTDANTVVLRKTRTSPRIFDRTYKVKSPYKDYMEEKERKTGKFKLAGGSTGLLSARVQTNDIQKNIDYFNDFQ